MRLRQFTRMSAWALVAALAWPAGLRADPWQGPQTLATLFEAAWARQPQALSEAQRRQALAAEDEASRSWLSEAPAVLLQGKTERQGAGAKRREWEVGLALPLWRPGLRQQATVLSQARVQVLEAQAAAQRLRLAGQLRDAWWRLHRAQADAAWAQSRVGHAREMALDVARRVKAGDLARADQHLADGAVAQAESALAEAEGVREVALQALKALTGGAALKLEHLAQAASEEREGSVATLDGVHPVLAEAQAQQALASASAQMALASSGGTPELTVLSSRSPGTAGEPDQQGFTVGLRLPWGGGARATAQQAQALAHAQEAQALVLQAQADLSAQVASAGALLRSAQAQWQATVRQAQLAQETAGFFERSFRLGETDLPTHLRMTQDAALAQRAKARAHMDVAAAWSAWWQAQGALPRP